MGFEPTYDGFANHCLAAWLPHRMFQKRLLNERGEAATMR